MIIFSRSPRNQPPNHGRKAGDKFSMFPKKDQPVPVTVSEDCSSVSQVTPSFPSHPIFGAAHPPVVPGYGPFTTTGVPIINLKLINSSLY